MDTVIDFVFLIDVFIGFCTSVIPKDGHESFDSRLVFYYYTNTKRFYLDVLAIFGTNLFIKIHRYFRVFGYFKLTRIFKIDEIVKKAQVRIEVKALMNLARIFIYLLFVFHLFACYLWITIEINGPKLFYRNELKTKYMSWEGYQKYVGDDSLK